MSKEERGVFASVTGFNVFVDEMCALSCSLHDEAKSVELSHSVEQAAPKVLAGIVPNESAQRLGELAGAVVRSCGVEGSKIPAAKTWRALCFKILPGLLPSWGKTRAELLHEGHPLAKRILEVSPASVVGVVRQIFVCLSVYPDKADFYVSALRRLLDIYCSQSFFQAERAIEPQIRIQAYMAAEKAFNARGNLDQIALFADRFSALLRRHSAQPSRRASS